MPMTVSAEVVELDTKQSADAIKKIADATKRLIAINTKN
jgi:hypothetical protein